MRFIYVLMLAAAWVFGLQPACFADSIELSGNPFQPTISVHITGTQASPFRDHLQENAGKVLTLHLVTGDSASALAVSGKYTITGQVLSFVPLYPLGSGLTYEIHYRNGAGTIRQRLKMPSLPVAKDTSRVISVFPLSDTIPSNVLFFHVRFSHPMANDQKAYTYVDLFNEEGKLIEQTWRQHSFWLDSMRVLVLMIHPGRVKTGIRYIGPVFEKGKKYTLRVDREIKDANGYPIKESAVKHFTVSAEDHQLPQIRSVSPVMKQHSKDTLVIRFSEGMDHASLCDGISLYNDRNEIVPYHIYQTESDQSVMIVPVAEWTQGQYKIVFKNIVSDFAANRINRPFEIREIADKAKDDIEVSRLFVAE